MNKLLEVLQTSQENQLKKFDHLTKKMQADKEHAVEDLKSKHRLEIEAVKQTCMSRNKSDLNDETLMLKQRHEAELAGLKSDMANLLEKFNQENVENERNIERLKAGHDKEMAKLKLDCDCLQAKCEQESRDYEQNMHKLKLFHEKELEARTQNTGTEYLALISNLKQELTQLNKDKSCMENELNKRYTDKLEEIVCKEEEIASLREALDNLQAKYVNASLNANHLNDKVWF